MNRRDDSKVSEMHPEPQNVDSPNFAEAQNQSTEEFRRYRFLSQKSAIFVQIKKHL